MSDQHASPAIRERLLKQQARPGALPIAVSSAGQGIRLSTVRSGLSWKFIDLPVGSYTLGSRSDCDVVIDVAGVAERHCTLIVGTQRTVVKAWTNRTWINEGVVSEGTLKPGDRLILGPIELHLSQLPLQPPGMETHLITSSGERNLSPAEPLSEEELRQLFSATRPAATSIPPERIHRDSRSEDTTFQRESYLQELKHEIEVCLQEVLRREHANREEFSRERLVLDHRSQELQQQWQHLEQTRHRLLQDQAAPVADNTAEREEQHLHLLRVQESQLNERHEELAGRSRQLVMQHRRLKNWQKELQDRDSEEKTSGLLRQLEMDSLKSMLARNEAQSKQLIQRQKEIEQREESVHQMFEQIAAGRMQFLEETQQLEENQRQWLSKCKNRERFFDEFEASLSSRMREVQEEESRHEEWGQKLARQEKELEKRLQEIELQQQGVDQAVQLLEQQQTQFAQAQQQFEIRQTAWESESRHQQARLDEMADQHQQLLQQKEELAARSRELEQQSQNHLEQEAAWSQRQIESDELHRQLQAEREQLQIALAESFAEQQNFQRLRSEIEAERQRDDYDRDQLRQTREHLDRLQQELAQERRDLAIDREELDRQRSELNFQFAAIPVSAPVEQDASIHTAEANRLEQLARELESQQRQLEEQRARLQADQRSLMEERDILERRQNQIESAREQLEQEQQHLESLRTDVNGSRQQLAAQERELEESRQQVQSELQNLQTQRDELHRRSEELEAAELRQMQERSVVQAESVSIPEEESSTAFSKPEPQSIHQQELSDEEESEKTSSVEIAPQPEESEDPEQQAAIQLRQQLANLFGLKPAAGSETREMPVDVPETADHEHVEESKDILSAGSPEEESASAAGSWSSSSSVEQTSQAASGSKTDDLNEQDSEESDSIAAYMERLLARNRQTLQSSNSESVAAAPSAAPRPVTPQREESQAESLEEAPPAVVRKTRKIDDDQKKTIRHNLHSFREVANQSARTAVAKSRRIRKSSSLRAMVALNIAGWSVAALLLVSDRWLTFSMYWEALTVAGISFFLTCLCLYRYKEIRKLALHSSAASRESSPVTVRSEGAGESETPEAKSGPLSFL